MRSAHHWKTTSLLYFCCRLTCCRPTILTFYFSCSGNPFIRTFRMYMKMTQKKNGKCIARMTVKIFWAQYAASRQIRQLAGCSHATDDPECVVRPHQGSNTHQGSNAHAESMSKKNRDCSNVLQNTLGYFNRLCLVLSIFTTLRFEKNAGNI